MPPGSAMPSSAPIGDSTAAATTIRDRERPGNGEVDQAGQQDGAAAIAATDDADQRAAG